MGSLAASNLLWTELLPDFGPLQNIVAGITIPLDPKHYLNKGKLKFPDDVGLYTEMDYGEQVNVVCTVSAGNEQDQSSKYVQG
jgi:hypothetical protein